MAFNFKSNKAKIFNPITLPFAKCYHSYAIIIGSHTDTHTHTFKSFIDYNNFRIYANIDYSNLFTLF